MGIRSRIFFIVFILLTISIAITYVVAERDLNNTFKQQTLNELEKKANLLVISVGSLARFDDIKAADLFANELGSALNSRVTDEYPSVEAEVILSSPATVLKCFSKGLASNFSASVGEIPSYPTEIYVIGMSISGVASLGICIKEDVPNNAMIIKASKTA